MSLNLLHLSDIHFKYTLDGTIHDLDHDVRHELEIDLSCVIKRSGPINAIVVTGDIAFAGKAEDYEVARKWLASLCKQIGCGAEQVWVVPGNHDIDRDGVTPLVRTVQNAIQEARLDNVDASIRQFVHDDPKSADVLASPFSEYHKFSAIYGCKPKGGHLTWQADLALDAGYTLRLVGLNSAFVSNDLDDKKHRPLIIGQAQLDMLRRPGLIYLSLCHHPASWLKDGEHVSTKLSKRASLQLFGHVHEQALQQHDNTLIVQAGALQPDREQDTPWCPAYNVLTLEIIEPQVRNVLYVTAYPRVWSDDHCFSPDPSVGQDQCQTYTLPIDDVVFLKQDAAEQCGDDRPETPADATPDTGLEYSVVNPARQLVYAFLTLPYSSQMRIADQLSLLMDEDAGLDSATLFERIYRRARVQNSLSAFWKQVSDAHPELNMTDNPYETSGNS